ncbi:cystathionine gamma-synthase family protein [Acidisoma sp. C75]
MAHEDKPGLALETLAIGAGYDPAEHQGAAKPPIYMTSTFVYASAAQARAVHQAFFDGAVPERGHEHGYIYARLGHPNLSMAETRIAAIDRAEDAALFSTGMAAVSTIAQCFLRPGDSMMHSRPIYGGTDMLLNTHMTEMGVHPFGFTDGVDEAHLREVADAAMAKGPLTLIMVESPANPTCAIADIALISRLADRIALAQGRRPVISVDNTFLGPFLQSPLEHGADLCLTSLTKYAGGHSDFMAGSVSGAAPLVGRLRKLRTLMGNHADPHSCWMLLRSVETMALRTERAVANAETIATFLRDHPKVTRITYLGFLPEGTPERAVYDRQCAGAGSTFSFDVEGGEAGAFRFLDRLRLLRFAVSLGGTETLICHPATTTHYAVPEAQRAAVHIGPATMRVSVGIEAPSDLIADLAQALEAV